MDNASLRDFRGGEGAYVADALERSLLLPADMAELGRFKEARGLPQHQEVFGHGKTPNTCGSVDSCSSVPHLPCACFNWQVVQVTYRLEEVANDQGRALELEHDKRLDATQTLKNSEADLLKAREDLKEMTRARDSIESGLVSAQKQAEDQTRCLLEAEDQLKIANE